MRGNEGARGRGRVGERGRGRRPKGSRATRTAEGIRLWLRSGIPSLGTETGDVADYASLLWSSPADVDRRDLC